MYTLEKTEPEHGIGIVVILYYRLTIVSYCIIIDYMIQSWASNETEEIWNGFFVRSLPHDIQRLAKRKLVHIHAARVIEDLRIPPGNRLEKLAGYRKDFWSIRINDQWRICFKWDNGNAFEVEIVDYH